MGRRSELGLPRLGRWCGRANGVYGWAAHWAGSQIEIRSSFSESETDTEAGAQW